MPIPLQFLLAMGLAIHAAAATAPCSPVPGADQIWSKASVHWVFIGELHGSNETPAAFRELVCDAIAQGKHVTVALERPTSEQAALDNILTAKDLAAAQESLLQLPRWTFMFGGAAVEAAFWKHVGLIAQVFVQSSPFPETSISSIDRLAVLLTIGGRYYAGKNSFELSLTEDPNTAGAPDFTLNFSFKKRF